jgi:hypothetical protein
MAISSHDIRLRQARAIEHQYQAARFRGCRYDALARLMVLDLERGWAIARDGHEGVAHPGERFLILTSFDPEHKAARIDAALRPDALHQAM